jgi:hypothetical protein
MFMVDQIMEIKSRTSSQFFAAQLLPRGGRPSLPSIRTFAASSDVKDADGHVLATAYAQCFGLTGNGR